MAATTAAMDLSSALASKKALQDKEKAATDGGAVALTADETTLLSALLLVARLSDQVDELGALLCIFPLASYALHFLFASAPFLAGQRLDITVLLISKGILRCARSPMGTRLIQPASHKGLHPSGRCLEPHTRMHPRTTAVAASRACYRAEG